MLDAIARSNGTRSSVSDQLFKTNVKNGIMGTFHFDKNGDICPTKNISFDGAQGQRGRLQGRRRYQDQDVTLLAQERRWLELGEGLRVFPSRLRRTDMTTEAYAERVGQRRRPAEYVADVP